MHDLQSKLAFELEYYTLNNANSRDDLPEMPPQGFLLYIVKYSYSVSWNAPVLSTQYLAMLSQVMDESILW